MPRRVLLDENLPIDLHRWLTGVAAVTVEFMGWKSLKNGDLVRLAKAERFAVLVTSDRLLAMTPRLWAPMGCVHVSSNKYASLRSAAGRIDVVCQTILPGQVLKVQV